MSTRFAPDVERRRDRLLDHAQRAGAGAEVFEAVSRGLDRLVPFDVAVWLPTDPESGLPSAPPVHA